MTVTFPGTRTLRVFAAAGRHLSFSKAAQELAVTPAAVSHQIKELEDQLGFPLFVRSSRRMQLTADGEMLHAAVVGALDGLAESLRRIGRRRPLSRLRISASPSIAAKWLVPRLDGFMARFPQADVRVDVAQAVVDFERDEVDAAIRFGKGDYPGLRAERLFEETVFPVCSPALLGGAKPLREPRDLLRHTLIHLDWQAQGATWPNWRMWMMAAGIAPFDDTRGLHFSQTSLAVQAALEGQGVALGESTLVADDLAAGRLVRPFALALATPIEFGYYLVTPPPEVTTPIIAAFRDWVLAEVGRAPGA